MTPRTVLLGAALALVAFLAGAYCQLVLDDIEMTRQTGTAPTQP